MQPVVVPMVSVVVPNYNYAKYLPQRMESIFGQSFQDFEIILLDDASTDNSAELIEGYRAHPKVSVVEVNARNSGSPFRQWEKGLSLAKGKYVWIAEADDLAHSDFLLHTVAALEHWPQASFAMTMSDLIDGDGAPSDHKSFDGCRPDGKTLLYDGRKFLASRIRIMNPCYNASQALIRRSSWVNMKRKDYASMRYCGDWLFWTEMLLGGDVAEVHLPLNSWRIHGNSTTDRSKVNFAGIKENQLVLRRLMDLDGVLPRDVRRTLKYRYYRNYLRDRDLMSEAEKREIEHDFFLPLGVTGSSYRWLSAYKHMMSPVIRLLGGGVNVRPLSRLPE